MPEIWTHAVASPRGIVEQAQLAEAQGWDWGFGLQSLIASITEAQCIKGFESD